MSKLNRLQLRKSFLPTSFFLLFAIIANLCFSQNKKINFIGVVLDSINAPIQGVTITSQQTKPIITTTDINGKFVIEVPIGLSLLITAIGYEDYTLVVPETSTVFTVRLKEKKIDLGEVVVVAFGKKQRKEAIVGSVTSISPKDIKIPSSNLTTALAGKISGLIAYQRTGEPGQDNASFFVRGVTTFGSGSGSPLILIDNIELTSIDLARLQPDDIESFSILKDASATSQYGARGANGIILITTKQGKEGKAKLSIRFENSVSKPTKNIKLADPVTYMELYTEAQLTRDPLARLVYQQNQIDHTKVGDNKYVYPATDWFGLMFKDNTTTQRVNLNITGGSKSASYYVAGSYNLDHGLLNVDPRNDFNSNIKMSNYQLRSNVNLQLTRTTELAFKMYGVFDDYKGPLEGGTSLYLKALQSSRSRFAPFYLPDSANLITQHILFGSSQEGSSFFHNPYAEMLRGYKEYSQYRMVAQFEINQNLSLIAKGLTFKALFSTNRSAFFDVKRAYKPFYYGVDRYDKQKNNYTLGWLNDPALVNAEYDPHEELRTDFTVTRILTSSIYAQGLLDFSNTFNEDHTVGSSLVLTIQEGLTADVDFQASLPHRNAGISGRLSYSYKSRYFAEFNFGYNGSERFYKTNQFGFFPTIGLAWVVSNEPFFSKFSGLLNKLKFRGSYGLVGNDAIGGRNDRFFFLSAVNLDDAGRSSRFGYNYDYSRNGVSVQRYANKEITWEKSYQTNFAVEIGLFRKLNLIAETYRQTRKNILQSRQSIPSTMGLDGGTPQANVGEAESRGVDLSLDYTENFNKNLWIVARGSFTFARGIYKIFEEPAFVDTYLKHPGQSISQSWGLIAERLFVDDKDVENSPRQNFGYYGAGDIKYRDVNQDGQITGNDRVPIGHPTRPEITYGFGFSAGFRKMDFSIFFQGLARESFWIDPRSTAPFLNNLGNSLIGENALLQEYANNHWSEETRDLYAVWPRLSVTSIANNEQLSTWFMRDGSFLRVKSLEFGYTLPTGILKKYKITNMRLYLSGTNAFVLSKFKLWDPEMGGNGLAYPIQKVYNIGLSLSF